MTHNNLLVFIIFRFNFPLNTPKVDNIDKVLQDLIVPDYDCTKMQNSRMYSLNKSSWMQNFTRQFV